MYLFEAKDISKHFAGHVALENVSISVPKGSVFGLLGPNGAGKTTLLRIVNQITGPDKGKLIYKDKPMDQEHLVKIGYLPEERGLYKKMKVGEQAIYLARLRGLKKKDAMDKLTYWFEKFDLMPWWNKKVEELSKGMQQKVQFITTVLHEPELLIFDEPFSGFDPINTNLLKNEILNLKQNGATIIFSTHNMNSVEELCDQVTLLNRSKVILEGSLHELRQKYKVNTYSVKLRADFPVNDKENIEVLSKKEMGGYINLRVQLKNKFTANEFIKMIISNNSEIISFEEEIPGMNDIFIKAVGNELQE